VAGQATSSVVKSSRRPLQLAVTLRKIELHGDSWDLATVKKYSGFDPDEPLPLEPIEWTPLQEGNRPSHTRAYP
jgi:hypothetical protein